MKKIEEKKDLGVPTPPEDETICLFAGLLANPDMPLSHRHSHISLLFTALSINNKQTPSLLPSYLSLYPL